MSNLEEDFHKGKQPSNTRLHNFERILTFLPPQHMDKTALGRYASIARTGGRVVECSGLENQRGCKSSVGSNPTPSATSFVKRESTPSNALKKLP